MPTMARGEIRDPNPGRSRVLVYTGVALLALGVAALVYASVISYLNAIL
jgi:hypothetical protein